MPDFGRWTSNGGDPSLNEINRTDEFLDALATQQPVYATDHDEADLANLLAGWRDDVRETPMSELVTTDEAARILDRGSVGGRRRFSLAVVGSAAAAVLCLGGFGAIVAGAGPGDALYGLRTMLFGEHATRDDAVILAAQTEMAQVQQLIDQGDWQAAQDKLETITTTVATVNDSQRKEELVTQWQELTVKVDAQDAAATVAPGEPLPTFPEPVVNLDPATVPNLTSDTSVTVQTTAPSEAVSPSVTTGPSGTTAPSRTTAPAGTTGPSVTTSPSEVAATSATTAPSATTPTSSAITTAPSSSAARSSSGPPSTTTTRSPSATTSTSVAAQSSSSAPAVSSSPTVAQSSAAAPSSSPAAAVPSPTATPVPTSAPAAEAQEPAPASSPAAPVTPPTTTTLIVEP